MTIERQTLKKTLYTDINQDEINDKEQRCEHEYDKNIEVIL